MTDVIEPTQQGAVNDVCYSPNGDLIASASNDSTVRLWEPTVYVIRVHCSALRSFLFSRDSLLLLRSRGKSSVLKAHAGAVRSVCFSSDSKYLLTAGDDKAAKVMPLTMHPRLFFG